MRTTRTRDRSDPYREELIRLTVDIPGLAVSRKRRLLDLVTRCPEILDPLGSLLPGLLALHDGTFREKGFLEKQRFFVSFRAILGGGVAREGMLRVVRILFPEGQACRGSGKEGVPRGIVPRLLEVIHEDPFARIRTAAALVLMRLGEPAVLGTGPEDYLCGLLADDVIAACLIVNFMLAHFGPPSLATALRYLRASDRSVPGVMIRLLESLCDAHLRRLDARWALIELKRRSPGPGGPPGDRAGHGADEKRPAEWRRQLARVRRAQARLPQTSPGPVLPEDGLPRSGPARRKGKEKTPCPTLPR